MQMRQHLITSIITVLTGIALVCMLVPHANAVDFVWDGNGDANNGGNWSNPLNWDVGSGYPDDSGDTADFTAALGSARYITNDVATTVDTVTMEDHANHHLVLGADLNVDEIAGGHDKYKSTIHVNGYRFTVGRSTGPGGYMPGFTGGGEIVKVSTGTATLQGTETYTGTITVSNGLLKFRSQQWDTTTLLTVIDGGTAELQEPGPSFPTNMAINGHGHSTGYGALHFSGAADSCVSDITVASDSKITRTGYSTTLTGDIRGSGVLSLEGSGIWILGGTDVTYTNKLIITNGTTQLSGNFPDLKHVLVDAGGVFEALQASIPNATIVTQNGGVWNEPDSAVWTGNGDANNGGNWSDTANWSPPVAPTNQADLQASLSSARYITNDVATTVDTIVMEDHANHHLVLGANLTVNTIDGAHDKYKSTIHVNGYTVTVGQVTAPGNYTPGLDGPGLFVKVSTGVATLQGTETYTGSFIVSNGTLKFRSGDYDTTILMTVIDGATAELLEPGPSFPTNIVINGAGYSGAGALRFTSAGDTCASDITLASDSKIVVSGAFTTTLTGDITGPGDLTFESASGGFDLDGAYNFAISGAAGNKIIADSGTVNITDATLSVTGDETATAEETVVIDFSGAGSVSGEFTSIVGLASGWEIDYDGTLLNPSAVVLLHAAPAGTIVIVK